MDEQSKHMDKAIKLALDNVNNNSGGPFGAVIVKDGKVIASAGNTVTTESDPTAHAEINAIRKACKELGTFDLHGCEIYASCEPCPMCLSAIYWARIDRLFYAANHQDAAAAGFNDAFIYEELAKPMTQRAVPSKNIKATEGKIPFDAWEKSVNKTPY